MVASGLADVVLTLVLVAAVSLSALSMIALVVGHTPQRRTTAPPARRALPAAAPATTVETVALARARATQAADRARADRGSGPQSATIRAIDAGQPTPRRDSEPASRAPAFEPARFEASTIEDVRDLVDHLIETDPQFLAKVITQWINLDPYTGEPRRQ